MATGEPFEPDPDRTGVGTGTARLDGVRPSTPQAPDLLQALIREEIAMPEGTVTQKTIDVFTTEIAKRFYPHDEDRD